MEIFPYITPTDFEVRNEVPTTVETLSAFEVWMLGPPGEQFDTQFGDMRRVDVESGVLGAYRATADDFGGG